MDPEPRAPVPEKGVPPPRNSPEPLDGLDVDGAGQRTEVGHPYDGEGDVRRGQEEEIQSDENAGGAQEPPD